MAACLNATLLNIMSSCKFDIAPLKRALTACERELRFLGGNAFDWQKCLMEFHDFLPTLTKLSASRVPQQTLTWVRVSFAFISTNVSVNLTRIRAYDERILYLFSSASLHFPFFVIGACESVKSYLSQYDSVIVTPSLWFRHYGGVVRERVTDGVIFAT